MEIYKFSCQNGKKHRNKQALSILLILSFLLIFAVSCTPTGTPPPNTEPETDPAAKPTDGTVLITDGESAKFRIVRPADGDAYIKTLAAELRDKIKTLSGVTLRVFTDSTPPSEDVCEILVGKTNRPESAAAYEGLDFGDWRVVAGEKTVAIAAYQEKTLETAVKRFIAKTRLNGKAVGFAPFTEEKQGVYDIPKLTLNGVDIAEYSIICEKESELAFAEEVRDLIAVYNGSYLEILTDPAKLASTGKAFYIGSGYYGGEADKKSEHLYLCSEYGKGMSLWYCDASACLTASIHLKNGLQNASIEAALESFLPGAKPESKEEPMSLKIMSFNVQNGWNTSDIGNRDDLAAGKILQYLPDVIGLQEFDPYYREAADPLTKLIAAKYTEVNVTGASDVMNMSWNPVFYNSERLTPKMFGSEEYRNGTSYNYPHGGKSKFRTISWVIFEDNQSKQSFLFVNTHYDMNTDKPTNDYNQRQQALQLLELVERVKQTYGIKTVFVVGDYNAATTGIPAAAMKEVGFIDAWAVAATKDNSNSCGTTGQPLEGNYSWAIDHIFFMADADVSVTSYKTVTDIRDASDHCPILAELTVGTD